MTVDTHVVPLRSGPPTADELRVYYPARVTWLQLKTFVLSGDLGLLKRDKKLMRRYHEWADGIKKEYGSLIDYLLNYRLQWGKPDTLSLLPSSLTTDDSDPLVATHPSLYPKPDYFKADIPFDSDLIFIMQNDWPYSVPPEIEHSLVWSRVPVFHPALIPPAIEARVQQHGLWGFTGATDESYLDLPTLESCLPVLADWGITLDRLIRPPKGSEEDERMVRDAGREVHAFVKRRWKESRWETAWFVNPPRLQSIRGLAHIHVFARRKTDEEEAAWCSS